MVVLFNVFIIVFFVVHKLVASGGRGAASFCCAVDVDAPASLRRKNKNCFCVGFIETTRRDAAVSCVCVCRGGGVSVLNSWNTLLTRQAKGCSRVLNGRRVHSIRAFGANSTFLSRAKLTTPSTLTRSLATFTFAAFPR